LGSKEKIPVNLYGSGFCRCLSIALALAVGNTKILFIDEIENGIHYSFHNDFWNFLFEASNAYNCQIIATTHSYEMIDAFCETAQAKIQNDVGYIRLAIEGNENKAYQFDFDHMKTVHKFNMEVR
jgi:AAA15 family ATPase/GTPase